MVKKVLYWEEFLAEIAQKGTNGDVSVVNRGATKRVESTPLKQTQTIPFHC